MQNKFYEFTLRVLHHGVHGLEQEGAYVPCYAGASDYQTAMRKSVARLAGMSYLFDDVKGPVREIDPSCWDEYVARVWPEFSDDLPSQDELAKIVSDGGVFFGPFAGFEDYKHKTGHEALR